MDQKSQVPKGMPLGKCQIHTVPEFAETLGRWEVVWQFRNRVRRSLKRRFRYVMNLFTWHRSAESALAPAPPLKPGDLVQVKSETEIRATLDNWNQLNRCGMMEEMLQYCGTTQRVLKRVERFLDERDYLMKKCKKIVLLEGVWCPGTVDFGPCDRGCHFFWREEWLEKID